MRKEDLFQQAAHAYLAAVLPPDAFHTFVDKAGLRSKTQGAQLKRRGIKSGIADCLLWWRGIGYWIELKSATGTLSDSQREIFPRAQRAGIQISVCRTIVDIHRALTHWAVPLEFNALDPATRDLMWQARLTTIPKSTKPRTAKPSLAQVRRGNRLALVGVRRDA